jgi:nitroreductase
MDNPTIQNMLQRKSVRKYTTQQPTDEVIAAVVRAGQQAPFAAQLYSILLDRKKKHAFGAPLLFTICVDMHKLELILQRRGWQTVSNNLSLLLFGIQDAAYAAENMVTAAESLGMGSCFLGMAPYRATRIQKAYHLPRGLPAGGTGDGYPAEDFPPRPRYR